MKRRVIWSRRALKDIQEQAVYIAYDNPVAARRIATTLRSTGTALGEHATGRPGRVSGIYEKSVANLPYIIAYSVVRRGADETISILRVIHAARDWQPGEWPE